ncbi:hypothetical protein ACIGG9_08815 [Pseudonocardia alni]
MAAPRTLLLTGAAGNRGTLSRPRPTPVRHRVGGAFCDAPPGVPMR